MALYEAAVEKNAVSRVFADIKILDLEVTESPDFIKYFANPVWSHQSKIEALKSIAIKLNLAPESRNCLDIIAENNRFADLGSILKEFVRIYYQKNNMVEVQIQSALALLPMQIKKLEANLEKMLDQKIVADYQVKPELLGGLKIKYGSKMIDDTIEGKLNRLEQVMKGGR